MERQQRVQAPTRLSDSCPLPPPKIPPPLPDTRSPTSILMGCAKRQIRHDATLPRRDAARSYRGEMQPDPTEARCTSSGSRRILTRRRLAVHCDHVRILLASDE